VAGLFAVGPISLGGLADSDLVPQIVAQARNAAKAAAFVA